MSASKSIQDSVNIALIFRLPIILAKEKCGKTVTCLIFICSKQVDIFCLLFLFFYGCRISRDE